MPEVPKNINWCDLPILKSGSSDVDAVKTLQLMLWWQGAVGAENPFWSDSQIVRMKITGPEDPRAAAAFIDGDFGAWTERSLVYFQQLAIGKDKIPLDEVAPVGTCDMDTWWSLFHYDLEHQDQGVQPIALPKKKSLGLQVVATWEHYFDAKVHEIPKGHNRGPSVPGLSGDGGIDVWTGFLGKSLRIKGPAWCCWSRTGVEAEAYAVYSGGDRRAFNGRYGLCYANWQFAKKQGWVVPKEDVISGKVKLPIGSGFIMNNGDITGHTGTVTNTIYQNGKAAFIEAIEGNVGDSVGRRKRALTQGTLKAFIVNPELLKDAVYEAESKGAKLSGAGEKTR